MAWYDTVRFGMAWFSAVLYVWLLYGMYDINMVWLFFAHFFCWKTFVLDSHVPGIL